MTDARLHAAAELIRSELHVDIGSDHAGLPVLLLRSGRVQRCIVVEKTPGPLETARQGLGSAGLLERCELRLGDGFGPLQPHELGSVSLTGLGARTMVRILERAPQPPGALVLQPNDDPGLLRRWAAAHGYWLVAERLVAGFWRYPVLRLEPHAGPDPAYLGLPPNAALRFGPHLLREQHPLLLEELQAQQQRLARLAAHGRAQVLQDLADVEAALAWLAHPSQA
ncbi:tRNA (adenine(22)-N(1))-methyltransferase TrmK [Deinococcus sonorensis]|uniref:tRNA (Adenine(22)-N(1))-methyltransferase TrmK n=2 Tax=Deinococcus sonorensis TaxID=309891 RepID=A0AAU7UDI9_9DEIO